MIRSILLSAAVLAATATQAQIANCSGDVGGTISSSTTSVCDDGSVYTAPTLTGYSGTLELTEYVFANPNDISYNADSTASGPNVLEINTTGVFDPSAYGLTAGDQFTVTVAHINLSDLQAMTEELLNGSFLFSSCCSLADLVSGFDVCGIYNSAGIFNGSDVTGLASVLTYTTAAGFGGSNSLEGALFSFDETNAQAGQPCTDALPICYATTNTLVVDVACATACSSATPPTNNTSAVGSASTVLAWDAIPGSVACQIGANRIIPAGPSPTQNLIFPEPNGTIVPNAVLGSGSTWRYRVRCACSISPIDATTFSPWDTFSIPVLREVEPVELGLSFGPNPASDVLNLNAQIGMTAIRVLDATGRVRLESRLEGWGVMQQQIDLSEMENGLYLLETEFGDQREVHRFTIQ